MPLWPQVIIAEPIGTVNRFFLRIFTVPEAPWPPGLHSRHLLSLGPDLHSPAAKTLIDAVGSAPTGGLTQGLPYTGLRLGIQIGGDLIQQQHSGVCRCGPCNGQQLPLPLREYPVRTPRVIPLRQRLDGLVDLRQPGGLLGHLSGDLRVAQGDLLQHGPRYTGKMLLHAADTDAPLSVRDG